MRQALQTGKKWPWLTSKLLTEVEHFYRLVSRNVCELGPYGKADARQMLHYLTSRCSVELSEKALTDSCRNSQVGPQLV